MGLEEPEVVDGGSVEARNAEEAEDATEKLGGWKSGKPCGGVEGGAVDMEDVGVHWREPGKCSVSADLGFQEDIERTINETVLGTCGVSLALGQFMSGESDNLFSLFSETTLIDIRLQEETISFCGVIVRSRRNLADRIHDLFFSNARQLIRILAIDLPLTALTPLPKI
ncbi:hypothetical protein B0H19DRAFT_1373902 [Mycena capillaripes]|nr:hypothetical protein B0H19DRAFT_1373902 [Mycena capillaripes]